MYCGSQLSSRDSARTDARGLSTAPMELMHDKSSNSDLRGPSRGLVTPRVLTGGPITIQDLSQGISRSESYEDPFGADLSTLEPKRIEPVDYTALDTSGRRSRAHDQPSGIRALSGPVNMGRSFDAYRSKLCQQAQRLRGSTLGRYNVTGVDGLTQSLVATGIGTGAGGRPAPIESAPATSMDILLLKEELLRKERMDNSYCPPGEECDLAVERIPILPSLGNVDEEAVERMSQTHVEVKGSERHQDQDQPLSPNHIDSETPSSSRPGLSASLVSQPGTHASAHPGALDSRLAGLLRRKNTIQHRHPNGRSQAMQNQYTALLATSFNDPSRGRRVHRPAMGGEDDAFACVLRRSFTDTSLLLAASQGRNRQGP
ncbi:hypothetical protein GMRT_12567 [Giardia muris]|uniref:Uncharacterized protein n=1 Tax=Giardia muris TaxID=5742 RepID=A0A4Z1STX6_GIAMU|nr:hypothetical protein GMRT_12567 [Giardia muris]|eukprot:TNJ28435.1 hypothetical protein GMRT_12567 [Giardia muris]